MVWCLCGFNVLDPNNFNVRAAGSKEISILYGYHLG
jgi:hypothetical protein